MSFQCPKCGFKDPPYWRTARHRYVSRICRISDLEFNEPKLADNIKVHGKAPNYYFDETYYYRLTKGNKVERTHKDDFLALKQGYYEKSEWKLKEIRGKPSNQSKLVLSKGSFAKESSEVEKP